MSAPNNTTLDASYNTTVADVHAPVAVNLRTQIDATASVSVYGPSAETVSNVIWCNINLDVSGLYSDPSNALIEFWEPSDNRGTIKARIASDTRNARAVAQLFSESLANVIKGSMDASAANPFQGYSGNAYTLYNSFGDVVVAYAAEGMFGHPSATAAITNDVELVDGFNNDTSKLVAVTGVATPSQTDQALAQRLAAVLYNSSDTVATAIAQVVIGQDASRATNADNSERQVDQRAPLRFYENDVVYVAVRLHNFSASLGANAGMLAQNYNMEIPTPAAETYYLRIRLTTGGQ